MLKSLYPDIPWQNILAAGFDIDGTLYDEFDFIRQVYGEIAGHLAKRSGGDGEKILYGMLGRWLEKGSSYPHIFSEVLVANHADPGDQEVLIKDCLTIFRNYNPLIRLSERVRYLLELFRDKGYHLFIVSDGSSRLQWNKFKALSLDSFFKKENVCISGDYGAAYQKPALKALEQLGGFTDNRFQPEQVVYFGDRSIDREFARQAGFYFVGVQGMHVVKMKEL